MLQNYLKSALTFLRRNRLFAIINLLGLSVALATSFIMLLYAINELSYNNCHKNSNRIYRILNYLVDFKKFNNQTPYVLANELKKEFPQVERAVSTKRVNNFKFKYKEEIIPIEDAIGTDSEIFDIFTLPVIGSSSNKNLLDNKNSIVISHDLAEKFFPGQNPVGQNIICLIYNTEQLLTVTGVFENIPENSTLRAQCFLNSKWTVDFINKTYGIDNADADWTQNFWNTWILLSSNSDFKLLENQFRAFELKNISETSPFQYSLQNLKNVYLKSAEISNAGITGNIKNVKLFITIAFLITIVAAINYIILSTMVSARRGLEIGLRKTFGASNRNIRYHLLSESILMALIVLPVAIALMWTALPYAGKLFQTQLNVLGSNISIYITVYIALTILIGLISGLYTSTYLSRLEVTNIIKNSSFSGKKRKMLRSLLVILQLIIFCSFVSSTLIIRSQYKYSLNKDLGHFKQDILFIQSGSNFQGYSAFINDIKLNPDIVLAAGTSDALFSEFSGYSVVPHFTDKDVRVQVEEMSIDYDFIKTMGLILTSGRDFSKEFPSDQTESVILNQTAVKMIGIPDPIGQKISNYTIIGVIKDFNLHSIRSEIPPLLLFLTDRNIYQIAVHYRPGTLNSILLKIKEEWKNVSPEKPFIYNTIEELIKNNYTSEKHLSIILTISTLFTLLIAVLGLFGLTLFVTQSKIEEIGLRKVFGSSESSIVSSLLLNNLILVVCAASLSIPISLYFMKRWLDNFAYKTTIPWWIFLISFLIAALVVLSTVFIHTFKASRINPVKALKYE